MSTIVGTTTIIEIATVAIMIVTTIITATCK